MSGTPKTHSKVNLNKTWGLNFPLKTFHWVCEGETSMKTCKHTWDHPNCHGWNVALPKKKKNLWGHPSKVHRKKVNLFFLLSPSKPESTARKYPSLEPFFSAFDHRNRKTGQICPIYAIQIPVLNKKGEKTASRRPLCPQFAPSASQRSICPRGSSVCKLCVTSKACFSFSKFCFPGAFLWCEELPTTTITWPREHEVHRCHTSSFQHKGSTSKSHKSVCNSL